MPPTEFLSLNGPDNAGKTTQIRLLSEARPSLQRLGSAHEHAPHLWRRLSAGTATWWFETSSTAELTWLLLESHRLRAAARTPGSVAVIDRGHPMLVAAATATCAVKDDVSIDVARARVTDVQRSISAPPAEIALLLLISRDAGESLAVSQQRDPTPWSPRYLRYQRTLHEVLMQQIEQGIYDRVVEWGTRSRAEIHREILAAVDGAVRDVS
jgi:hypothetical protein